MAHLSFLKYNLFLNAYLYNFLSVFRWWSYQKPWSTARSARNGIAAHPLSALSLLLLGVTTPPKAPLGILHSVEVR